MNEEHPTSDLRAYIQAEKDKREKEIPCKWPTKEHGDRFNKTETRQNVLS